MIIESPLPEHERRRYVTRQDVAVLFGVTVRTVANWVRRWKGSRAVRMFYAPTKRGPVLHVHLDDVIREGRERRRDFGDAFRRYMTAGEYCPEDPASRDEEIWHAITRRQGFSPDELARLSDDP